MPTKIINSTIYLFILIIGFSTAIAQGGPPPPGNPPVVATIDNAIIILMIAGVLLAIFTFIRRTKL